MTPGDVLQQADLASYIGAMAIGVAEAQRALDDNTINQLVEFLKPQPGLSGQSLLQVGLMPAFYAFRSATLSCSVSMTLKVSQSFNAGITVGTGTSTTSTKKITIGTKKVSDVHTDVQLSQSSKLHIDQNTSGMKAIHSYSEQNSSSKEQYALAERVAVGAASQYQASGLVQYNSSAALFVVPPAGKRWAVAKITAASAAGDSFTVLSGTNGAYLPPTGTSAKDQASGLLAFAVAGGVKGFILSTDTAPRLDTTLFAHDSYQVGTIAGIDYAERLRALAHILAAAQSGGITIVGHTDGTGPADYNLRLSKLRAQAVRDVLLANGITAFGTVDGVGEPSGNDSSANPALRNAEVGFGLTAGTYYVYLEETTGTLAATLTTASPAPNSYLADGTYPAVSTVQNGSTTVSSTTAAATLASEVSNASGSTVEATDIGELVYLTNKSGSDIAEVTVYARDESGFTEDSTTNLDTKTETSAGQSTVTTSEQTVNRSSAVVGSLDARYARMFDLSLSGNMSLAAELVNVPAPAEFLKFVRDNLGQGDGH
jgi:outer membrane protein OmpA-like peptidoglycan-associated protein